MKARIITLFFLVLSVACLHAQEIDYNNYRTFSKGGSVAVMDKDSNIVIPVGKYKRLYIDKENKLILAKDINDKYGYIDIKDSIIIPFEYEYLGLYHSGLALSTKEKGGLSGFIDINNQLKVKYKYYSGYFIDNNSLAIVAESLNFDYFKSKNKMDSILLGILNKKEGVIDTLGNEIIPCIYDDIQSVCGDSKFICRKRGKYSFFNLLGKRITRFEFDEVNPSRYKNLSTIRRNHEYAIIDKNLNYLVDFGKYDSISEISNTGIAIVKAGNKYAFLKVDSIDSKGVKYENLFPRGRTKLFYIALNDGKFRLLDSIGNNIFDKEFTDNKNNSDSKYIIGNIGKDYYFFDNGYGDVVLRNFDTVIRTYYQYLLVIKNGKYGIYDIHKKELLISICYDSINILDDEYFAVKNNGKWGFINWNQELLIPYIYDMIENEDIIRNFIVKKDGKFGTVDSLNNIITPIEYDCISGHFDHGPRASYVRKDNKIGMINHRKNIYIPAIYDEIIYTNDSIITVLKEDKRGLVDIHNRIIIPIEYEDLFLDINYLCFYKEGVAPKKDVIFALKNGKWESFDRKGNRISEKITRKQLKKHKKEKEYQKQNETSYYEFIWRYCK